MPVARALLVIALLGSPVAAQQGADFAPSGLLAEDKARTLDITPTRVLALNSSVYVLGTQGEGHLLLHLDAQSLEPARTVALPFRPDDMVASRDRTRIHVIGQPDDGPAHLLTFDQDLEPLGDFALPVPVAHATLSLADGDRLLVGGLPSGETEGALLAIDLTEPDAPRMVDGMLPETYNLFGIAGAWLDNSRGATLFINTGLLPTLVAVGIGGKGVVEYADLSFADDSSGQAPLTVQGFMPSQLCRNDAERAAFLLSSEAGSSLYLALYDPDFNSLDIVSRSEFALPMLPAAPGTYYQGTGIPTPNSLLASSCDLGVVWIGNRNSREIEQFAVNPQLMTLEKVGEIALSAAPDGLSMTDAGRAAFAISSGARSITRYHSAGADVIGTDAARNLQRLLTERDYPVGAIDGQIGKKTLSALERFEKQNGITVDIRGDLEGAIDTIIRTAPLDLKLQRIP